ncbi:hypothetical protein Hdeb2414_s0006g00224921 [Helianthus debilis subsp. tardiflorus]
MQPTVHSWSTPEHSTNTHIHTFYFFLYLFERLLLFVFAFLSSRSVEMSSYWDGNYIFGQYSSEKWGHESVPDSGIPDSNEQEDVVSSIQGKQNSPFLHFEQASSCR